MDYDMETKAAVDTTPPAIIELKRLSEVIEALDQRVDMLTHRLEMVLEPDGPETPGPNGVRPDDARASAPVVHELRHLAARLHHIESRVANLSARIQV